MTLEPMEEIDGFTGPDERPDSDYKETVRCETHVGLHEMDEDCEYPHIIAPSSSPLPLVGHPYTTES